MPKMIYAAQFAPGTNTSDSELWFVGCFFWFTLGPLLLLMLLTHPELRKTRSAWQVIVVLIITIAPILMFLK
jgi:hypothetical protein